ncbi:Holliday junction resolvase RuvX [Gammaproteobacteria bacterium]|nr:Holliday junction resolvase RuvX [Gammaproteobacteria bacterium]|tara:strand:- start:82 stop:561 length:480 start_codon:yes stop_codon:yes gene_type:complete
MIYKELIEAIKILESKKRLIGIDLGTKTIGLAISDPSMTIASPLETINRKKIKIDLERIQYLINEFDVHGIILGYPINMNYTAGPRTQSTMSFAREIEKVIDIPIILWDERLSTSAAEKVLINADLTRKKRKLVIDKMAATYILQGALDRIRTYRNDSI